MKISFNFVISLFLYLGAIIRIIVSSFFWFAAMLLEIALGLEEFTEAGVVQMGWQITRDLANMFFVLILLVIAFATILRIETYGMKSLLPKLVIAALLINFSLVLAGLIIDFSQVLTYFFYDQIGSTTGVSAQLAKALNIQSVYEINKESGFGDALGAGAGGVLMVVSSLFLGIILILCATFALGVGAFFLIVRLIILWILLILAPIAWLMFILPHTAHLFRQWWNTFLKWVFFAPIYFFFVYLAVKAAEGGAFTSLIRNQTENIINASGFTETSAFVLLSVPSLFLQFICIIGLLFGGLIVAQKMGVYGAQGAMGVVKGVSARAAKWPGQVSRRTLAKMAPPPKKTPSGKLEGGLIQRGLSQIAKIKIAGKLAIPAFRGLEQNRAMVQQEKESIKGWASKNLVDTFDRAPAEGKVARMLQLHENDDLDMLKKPEQRKKGLKLAQRYGQESKLVKAMPSLAGEVNRDVQEVVNKIKPEQAKKIVPEEIDKIQEAIVKAFRDGHWTSAHLGQMGPDPGLRSRIQKIMTKENIESFPRPVQDYLGTDLGRSLYAPEGEPFIKTASPAGAGGRKISEEELEKSREALKK